MLALHFHKVADECTLCRLLEVILLTSCGASTESQESYINYNLQGLSGEQSLPEPWQRGEQGDYGVSPVPQRSDRPVSSVTLSRPPLEGLRSQEKHAWWCFCLFVVILSRAGEIRKTWKVRTRAGKTSHPDPTKLNSTILCSQVVWRRVKQVAEISVSIVSRSKDERHCGNTVMTLKWQQSTLPVIYQVTSSFGSNRTQTCLL